MRKRNLPLRATVLVAAVSALTLISASAAFAFNSGGNPGATGANHIEWTGQGATNGQLNTSQCDAASEPNGQPAGTPYLLWLFTTDGGSVNLDPTSGNPLPVLHLGGSGTGNYSQTDPTTSNSVHFATPYYVPDPSTLQASATFYVTAAGNGGWNLVISHGCAGTKAAAAPTISKSASGSYDNKYTWTVTKSADTKTVHSAGGGPSNPVNYTVDVSHDAGTISSVKVTGTITVANPNPTDPIEIMGITDTLSDNTACTITDAVPSSLPVGDTKLNYECDLSALPTADLVNTAVVSWGDQTLPHDGTLAAGSASFNTPPISFTANTIDNCLTVSDKLDSTGPHTFCVGDPGDPNFSFGYKATFTDTSGTCTSHDNTAAGMTNTTQTEVDSNTVTVGDCQGADLTVTKTATPSYTRTFGWSIAKSADPAQATIDPWASGTFNYTVNVTHDNGTDSAFAVSGTITVKNPNTWEDISGVNVGDSIDNGGSCTVQQSSGGVDPANATIPANGSVDFPYTCTFGSNPGSGTNTATATWDASKYSTPDGTTDGTADYTFGDPTTLKDRCFTVTDSFNGGSPLALGVACIDPTSWTKDAGNNLINFQESFTDPTFTFTYSRTIHAPSAGACASYPNTAIFTTNDTGSTGQSSASVKLCSYQAPLTIGYWGNHLDKTGQPGCTGLPTGTGCSNIGPWAKNFLPQPLGGYSVDTVLKAAKVIAANNCSNASSSSQNAVGCLAAQLLAAELNVAFGSNACIVTVADGINNANTFLSGGLVDGVTGISYTGPASAYSLSTAQRNEALVLKNKLVNYNQGGGC
jgi:hypothetical protein